MPAIVTTTRLHIVVRGSPTPQGSKRAIAHKTTGRPVVIEQTHERLRAWRSAVVAAARIATSGGKIPPFDGPVIAAVTFTLRRPRNHFRTGRYSSLLRDDAAPYPMGTPDASKLLRATEDALTDARVWKDDALLVQCWIAKYYPPAPWIPGGTWNLGVTCGPRDVAGVDGADVMAEPGAVIRIERMAGR